MSTDTSDSAKTQCAAILAALESGASLTSLDALRQFGCMRLASRVNDLRQSGWPITTTMVRENGKRYARYTLEQMRKAA